MTRLRAGLFGIRVPREKRDFYLLQLVLTLPGAQWVLGCFHGEKGVKRPRREVNNPLPSSPEVKERVELISLRPLHIFMAWTGTNLHVARKRSCSEDGSGSGCPRVPLETPDSRTGVRMLRGRLHQQRRSPCTLGAYR